jgi:ACR3 family arsenite transporter
MTALGFLAAPARHARLLLVAGLLAGIALPGAALALKPWLPEMIAALLSIAALKIGPRHALGAVSDLGLSLAVVLVFQLALPIAAVLLFLGLGWSTTLLTGLVLMAAASPISGSPNLTMLTGNDPAPALRLLVLGTALLPLTVIPVFWLSPEFGDVGTIAAAAGRLLVIITLSAGAAFAIRHFWLRNPAPETLRAIDGASALAMAIVVVGLMSAVGPAIINDPGRLVVHLAAAFAANFGLQFLTTVVIGRTRYRAFVVPLAIVAGNRNIALFLTALPASVTDPLLLFIGCYQIPMYLTPMLLGRFYRAEDRNP